MKRKYGRIYQFKIALNDIEPPVWRRILVPETYTFWDLHVAIQDAMGWYDTHLHEFEITNPSDGVKVGIGIPDEDFDESEILPGWKIRIADFFSDGHIKAEYTYDFGDNWTHTILFEKILPRERGIVYPACIGGERACPPEDVGGPDGYENFLRIIMDPRHKRYKEMLDWAGDFEPEYFDSKAIIFDDPSKRLKEMID